MCVGSWAGVTYLRFTVLMSPNKDETAFSVAILLYRFLLCLVSQNVFRIESALPELFVFTYFRLIRSFDEPTLAALIVCGRLQFLVSRLQFLVY